MLKLQEEIFKRETKKQIEKEIKKAKHLVKASTFWVADSVIVHQNETNTDLDFIDYSAEIIDFKIISE